LRSARHARQSSDCRAQDGGTDEVWDCHTDGRALSSNDNQKDGRAFLRLLTASLSNRCYFCRVVILNAVKSLPCKGSLYLLNVNAGYRYEISYRRAAQHLRTIERGSSWTTFRSPRGGRSANHQVRLYEGNGGPCATRLLFRLIKAAERQGGQFRS